MLVIMAVHSGHFLANPAPNIRNRIILMDDHVDKKSASEPFIRGV